MKRAIFSVFSITLATAFTAASAFTLNGTVTDEVDAPVAGAALKLLAKGDTATTDQDGKFTISEDDALGLSSGTFKPGHIDIVDGVLRFAQSTNSPVQVSIFDIVGNQVLRQELLGSGQVDLRQGVTSQGTSPRFESATPSKRSASPRTEPVSATPFARIMARKPC